MRSTRNQPFCWQEKKILRILRKIYDKSELVKLRNLYLTITEIDSDFNNKDIKYYTKTIHTYSGLSKEWIPTGLKKLQRLNIIQIIEEREKGKYKGKKLIFTPEKIQEIPVKTVKGKTINGKTLNDNNDTSKDISYLEDNNKQEDNKFSNSTELQTLKKHIRDHFKEKSPEYFKTGNDCKRENAAIKKLVETDFIDRFDNQDERIRFFDKAASAFKKICDNGIGKNQFLKGTAYIPSKLFSQGIWVEVIKAMKNKSKTEDYDYSDYEEDDDQTIIDYSDYEEG